VVRDDTLQNVIQSVTRNGRSIVVTGILGVIIVYLFSVVGYLFLRDVFLLDVDDTEERVCDSLLMCIVTSMNHGLRNGGGIGDVLKERSSMDPLFAARVVYDLLFFFVLIVIVLNLIFGVIIDTFADLRVEKYVMRGNLAGRTDGITHHHNGRTATTGAARPQVREGREPPQHVLYLRPGPVCVRAPARDI